jgi:hypothetical protein
MVRHNFAVMGQLSLSMGHRVWQRPGGHHHSDQRGTLFSDGHIGDHVARVGNCVGVYGGHHRQGGPSRSGRADRHADWRFMHLERTLVINGERKACPT